jgi:hypothetical protein
MFLNWFGARSCYLSTDVSNDGKERQIERKTSPQTFKHLEFLLEDYSFFSVIQYLSCLYSLSGYLMMDKQVIWDTLDAPEMDIVYFCIQWQQNTLRGWCNMWQRPTRPQSNIIPSIQLKRDVRIHLWTDLALCLYACLSACLPVCLFNSLHIYTLPAVIHAYMSRFTVYNVTPIASYALVEKNSFLIHQHPCSSQSSTSKCQLISHM